MTPPSRADQPALQVAIERLSAGLAIAPDPRPRIAEFDPGPFAAAGRHADLTRRTSRRANLTALDAVEATVLARATVLQGLRTALYTLTRGPTQSTSMNPAPDERAE